MSIQRDLEEHRKKKQEILEDMKACITYSPNQENDLLCLIIEKVINELGGD